MANTLTLAPLVFWQSLDDDANPLSSGKIYTYITGTTTPLATYTNATPPLVAHSNPIILDSGGRPTGGPIYLAPATYKFVLKDSNDVLVATTDPVGATAPFTVDFDIPGTAGETLTAGNVVFLSDGSGGLTAGLWYKGDADDAFSSSNAPMIGMVPADIASGTSGSIRIVGRVTGLSALTAGNAYYISTTAGGLTAVPPANKRQVGTADSSTSIIMLQATSSTATASPSYLNIETFAL